MKKKSIAFIALVLAILVIDQALKIYIKTNFYYGQSVQLFGWEKSQLFFVENEGMAFGLTLGGSYGKLILSLFRIFVVGWLIYYIRHLVRFGAGWGLLTCFGMILAGAIGNIIDSSVYGMIFSASNPHTGELATMFPAEGGYSSFLHGKVVDMLYFPLLDGRFPEWLPIWGGEDFLFFRPVFNIADAAISVGVISLILFQRSFFQDGLEEKPKNTDTSGDEEEKLSIENAENS